MASTPRKSHSAIPAQNDNTRAEDAPGYIGSHPMIRENQPGGGMSVRQRVGIPMPRHTASSSWNGPRVYSIRRLFLDLSRPIIFCRVYGQDRQRIMEDDCVDKQDQDDKMRWDAWRNMPASERGNIVAYFEAGDERLDWEDFQAERAERIARGDRIAFLD